MRERGAAAPPPTHARTPVALPRHGFPLVAIPPLVALVTTIAATAYATLYSLLKWGDIGPVGAFLSGAAPSLLGSLPDGRVSAYGLPGIAVSLIAALVTTTILASLSGATAGRRLVAGALVSVPTVIFTIALVPISRGLMYTYASLGEQLAQSAGGAAIVGFLGGLLGALLSLVVRPPPPPRPWISG